MRIKITPNDRSNPPGKLADAELHFTSGPLEGLKLIGFAIWERRTGNGRNVTFPARAYTVNGERRSFALLRPITDIARARAHPRSDSRSLRGVRAAADRSGGAAVIPRVRELRLVYSRGRNLTERPCITQPADAALLLDRLSREPVEVVCLLLLDTKHHVIATHDIGRGTLDACPVHPRDVFKAALLANAAAVIVAHNHPSGDPTPSSEDTALCKRLREASDLLGIPLLDFLIIGDERYVSFNELGR